MPFVSTVGFGGVVGFLAGYAIKKILKIIAVIAGIFFAALMYLQFQNIVNVNWARLQPVSQSILTQLGNIVTTGQVPGIDNLATTTTTTTANLGIPLTGSAAMGFTIGLLKG